MAPEIAEAWEWTQHFSPYFPLHKSRVKPIYVATMQLQIWGNGEQTRCLSDQAKYFRKAFLLRQPMEPGLLCQ